MCKTIKKIIINSLALPVLLMLSSTLLGQTISGNWITIDSKTGKDKSVVQIWKAQDDMFYGKIIKIFDESKTDNVCDKCDKKDSRYMQKVLGMKIIMEMKKTGTNEWTGGTILNRDDGKVYKCKMSRVGDNLLMSVIIGFSFVGQTQTWLPAKSLDERFSRVGNLLTIKSNY